MVTFAVFLAFVLGVWALCSLAEAAIYAVPLPFVRQLEQSNEEAGRILARFKDNMERPISAILIINTIVAAGGASFAGAQAQSQFGEASLWLFSACFTMAALFLSEIVPKIIGVAYNRSVARLFARPLLIAVNALYPIIWLISRVSPLIKPTQSAAVAPEGEVQSMAELSAEEGSIMQHEADLVRHVLDLDKVTAGDIMTPKSVVVGLPADVELNNLDTTGPPWNYSRLPISHADSPDMWIGYVLSREVLQASAAGRQTDTVEAFAKPLFFVHEGVPGHRLLEVFLHRRTHIFGVVSDAGKIVGIVTLEDVLESLIGAEIVDESDTVVDMQALAAKQSFDG